MLKSLLLKLKKNKLIGSLLYISVYLTKIISEEKINKDENEEENGDEPSVLKHIFHLSILYSINIYNLNDEDLKNMNNKIKMLIEFLTKLNHKKGMNDIKKELQKINIKEILLIPNNCELIDKYSSILKDLIKLLFKYLMDGNKNSE